MTFRIQTVRRTETGSWVFELKGIRGTGKYGQLEVGPDGAGLALRGAPGKAVQEKLLPDTVVLLPPGCSLDAAVQRLAAVLLSLGWGPEVEDPEALSLELCREPAPRKRIRDD